MYTVVVENEVDEQKTEETKAEEPTKTEELTKTEEPTKVEEDPKPDVDLEMALKQIRKGWSVQDAGDLTVGDLYLMVCNRIVTEISFA